LGRPWVALTAIAALLCWQTQETLRRALMAHLRHAEALWGDSLRYLGLAAILLLCLRRGHASLELVFAVIAATSILAALLQACQLRLALRFDRNTLAYSAESWKLSRWALVANAAVVLPSLAFPWLLALRGTQAAASFQALVNLLGVTNPVLLGISNIALPAVARTISQGGIKAVWGVLARYGAFGAMLIMPCYLALALWPGAILRAFYGAHSPYITQVLALRLLVAGYSIGYVCYLFATFFYGLGQSKTVMKAQGTGAAVAMALGFPLIVKLGVPGASLGIGLVYMAQAAGFVWLLRQVAALPIPGGEVFPIHADQKKAAGGPLMRQESCLTEPGVSGAR